MIRKRTSFFKKNSKFVKRFLCLLLCFVLLGLMVPNGVSTKLNAIAQGNETYELPSSQDFSNKPDEFDNLNKDKKVTDENSSDNLESSDKHTSSDSTNDDSNNNIINIQAKMTITAPGEVRFDKNKTGAEWPSSVEFIDESPAGSGNYRTIIYNISDGDQSTYGEVIKFVQQNFTAILVNDPDGSTFVGFNFTNKDITLSDIATEDQSIEAYYAAPIVVNNDGEHPDAVLKLHDSQGEHTLDWGQIITNVKYGYQYSLKNSKLNLKQINEDECYIYVDCSSEPDYISKGFSTTGGSIIVPNLEFNALYGSDYQVNFYKTQGHGGDGTFTDKDGKEISSIKVGVGTYFEVDKSDKNTLTFYNRDGSILNKITVNADEWSIFRKWVYDQTIIQSDVDITATLVSLVVEVKFVPADGSRHSDSKDQTTIWIEMDTAFSQSRTDLVASAIFLKSGATQTQKLNVQSGDKTAYKFADPAFELPGSQKQIINETNYPDIESNGLKINYMIQEREKCEVKLDLSDGVFVGGYLPPEVVTDFGGIGAWVKDGKYYKNYFYEGFAYNLIVNNYLTNEPDKIDKHYGFFNGEWECGSEKTILDKEGEAWTAQYDAAGWISGSLKCNDKYQDKEPINNGLVEISSEFALNPQGDESLTIGVDADNKFSVKVYDESEATLHAGAIFYAQSDDISLKQSDWKDGNVKIDFSLDKGFTWVSNTTINNNKWYAKYDVLGAYIDLSNASYSKLSDVIKFDKESICNISSSTIPPGEYTDTLQVGHELCIYTKNSVGNISFNNSTGISEYFPVDDEITYSIWNRGESLQFSNPDDNLAVTRVDYKIPAEKYIAVKGQVSEANTNELLKDIDVVFYDANALNGVVKTFRTQEDGSYHLILKQGSEGYVYFKDNNMAVDDHLDERFYLNGTEIDDISQFIAMSEAIRITGTVYSVYYPDKYHPIVQPCVDATVSYTNNPNDYPEEWGPENHGYAKTDAAGNYVFKLRKDSTKNGGYIWFNKEKYAQGGHELQKDGVELPHNMHIDGIGDNLEAAGATVSVVGNTEEGHKTFECKYFEYGNNFETFECVTSDALSFAAVGKFYSGYDEYYRNILIYEYNPLDEIVAPFTITLRPIANDGYTYWAWRVFDPLAGKTITLLDDDEITDLKPETSKPYVFSVDYALASDISILGNQVEGHAGWNLDIIVNGNLVATRFIASDENFDFQLPISRSSSNDLKEPIESTYVFDGASYIVTLNSEFDSSKEPGKKISYSEERLFTPIPADFYQFEGISVNDKDLIAGQQHSISDQTALNVLAKYSSIPIIFSENASTGDNFGTLFWILGGITLLALIATLTVWFVKKRKQGRH